MTVMSAEAENSETVRRGKRRRRGGEGDLLSLLEQMRQLYIYIFCRH
jgi:hypothetical protein